MTAPPVFTAALDTPIGPLRLAASDAGLHAIDFPQARPPARGRERWQAGDHALLREAAAQLRAYFDRRLRAFDLPLAADGTAFQREVWQALARIPYGTTVSYVALARGLGRPTASRAVGAANGRNPIPIVVPCHRVIGASGALTGFAGGVPTKRFLLDLEGALPAAGGLFAPPMAAPPA
ncbi:methylated-DNA--[protein]-cysteine S-methyltransferase [Luteimonas sp. FCS-9]|uniref:methylated-DNA--[protein]-cysteine S-methyltransferase n=1 Tax=Luteimonas sp. FCS-9 TaxID=1547516 RepID=UPI0009E5037D|nr:methylated-DNA--[protein]-cysteine S-methyltransferase [Luteimonas sp. FCS-9]